MVTVTVAEDNGAISELFYRFLLKKKNNVTKKTVRPGLFRLSFMADIQTDCNILLLHTPCDLPDIDNDIVLLNTDQKIDIPAARKPLVITYGLNPLATVTASSLDKRPESRLLCCLQRSFVTLSGMVLDPQEFPVAVPELATDDAIAFITLGLLLAFLPEELKNPFNPF